MGIFVEKIKQNIKDRNITDRYVSLMTGWSIEKVNDIMNGSVDPIVSDIEFMAAAIECNIPEHEQRCDIEAILNINDTSRAVEATADKLLEMLRFYDAIIDPGV